MADTPETDSILETALAARTSKLRDFPPCTILVLGKSGVGKSTLVNAVFGEDLAATGTGSPVTKHLTAHTLPDSPVTILDTRGIELRDTYELLIDEVRAEVDRRAAGGPDEHVHVLWFCTSAGGMRLEAFEHDLVVALAGREDAPIAAVVVATQDAGSDAEGEFVDWLRKQGLPGDVVSVMAQEKVLRSGAVLPAFGLDDLLEATRKVLPAGQRRAFDNAQRVDLGAKSDEARALVAEYTAGVPLRTNLGDIVQGKDLKHAASEAARRMTRLAGEIAAIFGEGAVPKTALKAVLDESFGGARFSDIADKIAAGLGMLAGWIGANTGPAGGRVAKAITSMVGGKVIGGGAKLVDAHLLQRQERKMTQAFGEATIETFVEFTNRSYAGDAMSDAAIGAFFERAFERAVA